MFLFRAVLITFPLFMVLTALSWAEPPAEMPKAGSEGKRTPKQDLYGDVLPANALARMGTVRLRHPGVVAVAFSTDGKMLASADGGNGSDAVRIWEVASGKELQRLEGPTHDSIRCLTFRPMARGCCSDARPAASTSGTELPRKKSGGSMGS